MRESGDQGEGHQFVHVDPAAHQVTYCRDEDRHGEQQRAHDRAGFGGQRVHVGGEEHLGDVRIQYENAAEDGQSEPECLIVTMTAGTTAVRRRRTVCPCRGGEQIAYLVYEHEATFLGGRSPAVCGRTAAGALSAPG